MLSYKKVEKTQSNQSHRPHNTVIEIANRLAKHTLYSVCCLIYFGHTKRGRGREARCDGIAGEEQSWPISKPLSILDIQEKRSMNRNDDVHSPHTRKPLHCDLPVRNSQQNVFTTGRFDNNRQCVTIPNSNNARRKAGCTRLRPI